METAAPLIVFTITYLATDELRPSIIGAVGTAVAALALRLVQQSDTRFARHGLIGTAVAAAVASFTGQAEDAFLPGILQNALWALVLGGSLVIRRPVGGFVIGAALNDVTGWRHNPAIVRLGTQLTLLLVAPMAIRVAVQVPLYLAEAVGWLGVSRLLLGWPLHAVTLVLAGAILLRGDTPLETDAE